jgi:hypothetical protein
MCPPSRLTAFSFLRIVNDMAILQLSPSTLSVRFTRGEKIAGLVHDVAVPRDAVREVEVVSEPLEALHGLRAPGLALPGVRKIGTWRRPGQKVLVSVRRHQPAVRVRLHGTPWTELLVGTDDAASVAAALTAAR